MKDHTQKLTTYQRDTLRRMARETPAPVRFCASTYRQPTVAALVRAAVLKRIPVSDPYRAIAATMDGLGWAAYMFQITDHGWRVLNGIDPALVLEVWNDRITECEGLEATWGSRPPGDYGLSRAEIEKTRKDWADALTDARDRKERYTINNTRQQ